MNREWISVKDRLPKRGERVNCYSEIEGNIIATFYASVGWQEIIVVENIQVIIKHKVTHWYPLLDPPKDIK